MSEPIVLPSCHQAIVLCHFLENNLDKYSMADKNVMELGAGTGLATIVSSLLGIHYIMLTYIV